MEATTSAVISIVLFLQALDPIEEHIIVTSVTPYECKAVGDYPYKAVAVRCEASDIIGGIGVSFFMFPLFSGMFFLFSYLLF